MKVVLFGATGGVGAELLLQLLAGGHEVRVLVRSPERLPVREHPRLTVLQGELTDRAQVDAAVRGVEGALSTLGVARGGTAAPLVAGFDTVVSALEAAGVRRLVTISGAGLDVPGDRKGVPDKLVGWLLRRVAPEVLAQKEQEYARLQRSGLQWTLVRPPRIVPGGPTGRVRASLEKPPSTKVTRGDVAAFMLAQLSSPEHVGKAPFVAG
jgi:uncharacterized protein YbjT (DUF2867 family)